METKYYTVTRIDGDYAWLKRTDVELHLLDVVQPEEYEGLTTVQLADKVFNMMLDDLGPAYAPLEKEEN